MKMNEKELIDKTIVTKEGDRGTITQAAIADLNTGEIVITVLFEGKKAPKKFLLFAALSASYIKFEDKEIDSLLKEEALSKKKKKEAVAKKDASLMAEAELQAKKAYKKKFERETQVICLQRKGDWMHRVPALYEAFDVSSASGPDDLYGALSPYYLGPGVTDRGETYQNLQNLWEYSKVYGEFTDEFDNPTPDYWNWRAKGFADKVGRRYGTTADAKPIYYLWWRRIEGCLVNAQRLGPVQARKKLFIPSYAKLVVETEGYKELKEEYDKGTKIALLDTNGYLETNMVKVVNNPHVSMGHSFVIKMLLQGDIEVVDGQVIDHIGVLD